MKRTLILIAFLFLTMPAWADQGQIRVSWDASPSTDVAGYKVQWNGGDWNDAGLALEWTTTTEVLDGENIALVIAYDDAGNQSEPAQGTLNPAPKPPGNIIIELILWVWNLVKGWFA